MLTTEIVADAIPSKSVEKILLAAEIEFSQLGFDGAGMKGISARAEVSQGLLHYHFGTKERLYDEVIGQRAHRINTERLALLARVDLNKPDALELVLEAFFKPPLGPSGGAKPYARIFSRLVVGHEREQALVKEYYDPTARQFIKSIKRIVPGADQAKAAMCYSLAMGALIAVIGRDGRVERLMERKELNSIETLLEQLVTFTTGGVLALTTTSERSSDNHN